MEQVLNIPHFRLQDGMGYHDNKRQGILSLIADDIKISLQHISLFQTFSMKCKCDFFGSAQKMVGNALHPAVGREDKSFRKFIFFSNNLERTLICFSGLYLNLNLDLRKVEAAIIIFKLSI